MQCRLLGSSPSPPSFLPSLQPATYLRTIYIPSSSSFRLRSPRGLVPLLNPTIRRGPQPQQIAQADTEHVSEDVERGEYDIKLPLNQLGACHLLPVHWHFLCVDQVEWMDGGEGEGEWSAVINNRKRRKGIL